MKNLSDKTKKRLTVTGLVSLCAVMLLFLITVTSGGGSLADDPNLQANATPNDVNVEDVSKEPADDPGDIKIPVIPQKDGAEADPDSVLNVDTENHVEVDLTDISKPEPPDAPDGAHVDGQDCEDEISNAPASTNPPKSDPIPQQTNPPSNSTPKNGDKKDGMVYIDGFGWIKDEGGGTNAGTFDSDGDIDKQVGIMGGN